MTTVNTPCKYTRYTPRADGYVVVMLGQLVKAGVPGPHYQHRLVCAKTHGLKYTGDWVARHLCHNRSCAAEDHIVPGSPADNMRDTVLAGRTSRGERHPSAKLNEDAVRHIRACPEVSLAEFAALYGVTDAAVWRVRVRKTWKHIP